MEESFDHLDIINSVLSLAYNLESYPNHLYRAGYRVSRIEPRFDVNGEINPDILFMSSERGLICECKSGQYFVGSNIGMYQRITPRHLVEKGIDIPTENPDIDIGIFGNKNIEYLKERLKEEKVTYPQVVMDEFIQKKFGDDFKDLVLNDLFNTPVKVNGKPLVILRFSDQSSKKKIAPYIFSTLMANSVSGKIKFTPRELAEQSSEDIWDSLDKDLKDSLSKKVKSFLIYCKKHELKYYLTNRDDIWTININKHWKSRKKFSDDCNHLVKNFDQKMLYDFSEFHD